MFEVLGWLQITVFACIVATISISNLRQECRRFLQALDDGFQHARHRGGLRHHLPYVAKHFGERVAELRW